MHTSTTTFSRRRWARGLALGTVLTGLLASSVSAATSSVSVDDSRRFSPGNVTQTAGGNVRWTWSGIDEHSVTSDQGLFDSGLTSVSGFAFSRTFSAGTFPYHCVNHGDQGMRGIVRVAPQVQAAPRGLPFTVRWATTTQTGTRFDVQYRVGAGAWKMWKRNTLARSAVFGARSAPVRVVRNKTYSFRVVSRLGIARSSLSPVKSFRAS